MPASPLPPPPPAAPVGPRYRYTLIPPAAITLRAGDLIPFLPQDAWVLGSNAEHLLEFSTSEILKGPVPKVSLNTLVELAPSCFRAAKEGGPVSVRLPITRLAAAYHLVSHRELLEEAWVDPLPLPGMEDGSPESMPDPFAPSLVPEVASEEFAPPPSFVPESPAIAKSELPPAPVVAAPLEKSPLITPPSDFAPPIPPPPVPEPVEKPLPTSSRGIFSVLPMFRRKEQPDAPPIAPPASAEGPTPVRRPRVELPPPKSFGNSSFDEINPSSLPRFAPKPPIGAITTASWTAQPPVPPPLTPEPPVEAAQPEPVFAPEPEPELPVAEPVAEVIEPDLKEETPRTEAAPAEPLVAEVAPPTPLPPPPAPPKAISTPTLVVETQHLSAVEAKQSVLSNQDDLQAIFLTDETLTPERIVELCGGFPGINSCVLSRGGGVIASHNVPDTIDLVSLSAHALEMIRAMRESSAKMGVGAVPAVTIHSEKGPITFFHEEDLCFLVLHKDRGFVPGVREKLQHVVHHLAQARLPRPISQPSRVLEG